MTINEINRLEFPYLLQQIDKLPEKLNILGKLPSDENKFLCVVGSRKNSRYGEEVCRKLISGLAGYPIVIISGLAIGIDSIAHTAALENNLQTISFPGSGLNLNVLYPPSRKYLAEKIIESNGCIVSSFPNEFFSTKWTFLVRNRLMAGSSHATLIIEAGKKSGSLGTADYALKLNRDVLAVPGSIFSDLSYGPNMLIRSGATPITSSEDILEALGFEVDRNAITDTGTKKKFDLSRLNLNPKEKKIVEFLLSEPLSATDLVEKTALSAIELNILLTELELQGLIKEINGIYSIS